MDKYLKKVNNGGSNHQMYKRCIFDIIKDMRESIDRFNSNVFRTKEYQSHVVVKVNEIINTTTKYSHKIKDVDKIIKEYSNLYLEYSKQIKELQTKINMITTLKKIKEKHVKQACEYLEKIDFFWNQLDEIDSSINYNFIDEIYKKVQVELSEISLISGLMDGVEIISFNNIVDETMEGSGSEGDSEGDSDFGDFM